MVGHIVLLKVFISIIKIWYLEKGYSVFNDIDVGGTQQGTLHVIDRKKAEMYNSGNVVNMTVKTRITVQTM